MNKSSEYMSFNQLENQYPRGVKSNATAVIDSRLLTQSLPSSINEKRDMTARLGSENLEIQREIQG
jgi:hypothetical protein